MTKKIRREYKEGDAIRVRTNRPVSTDNDVIPNQIYEGVFDGTGHYMSATIKLPHLDNATAFILIAKEGVCTYCAKDGKWEIVEDD